MRKWTAMALLMSLLIKTSAQAPLHKTRIHGIIRDEQQNRFEGASVIIRKTDDTVILQKTVTDRQGVFQFNEITEGEYRILIMASGYSSLELPFFTIPVPGSPRGAADRDLDLGVLVLLRAATNLGQVTVTGRRPAIETRAGRTLINVDALTTAAGATALELLTMAPGVHVDRDGNISLKGKQGVLVLLDGKPTYLSSTDLAGQLSSMNAAQIDQIEILTMPPSKYEAAGNAGVINIRTKKKGAMGFNGNVTAGYGQGHYWKTNNSLNLNYRETDYNLFVSYTAAVNKGYTDLQLTRRYLQPDDKTVISLFDGPTSLQKKITTNTLKLGGDYFLSKKTTLGIVTTGMISPRDASGISAGYQENAVGHVDSVTYTRSTNNNRVVNGTVNLNLRQVFDSAHELTADADYLQYNTTNPQLFINSSYNAAGAPLDSNLLQGDLPSLIRIESGKIDYSQVLHKGWKTGGGWKSSWVQTDNNARYFDWTGTIWEPDYGKTNHFLYRENINALYWNLDWTAGKWVWQGGLRYENTRYQGHQLGNPLRADSSFIRHYNDLFPTAYASYQADPNNLFTIAAGRRIDRPAYQSLNPFFYFVNQYTYQVGNPFIVPQYTTNIELSHVYKGILTTTLNYSDTRSYFTQIFMAQGDTTVFTEGNLGRLRIAGLSVNMGLPLNNWWSVTLYANGGYKWVNGATDGLPVRTEGFSAQFNMNNQFRWKKGWAADVSGWLNTRDVEGQFILHPQGQLSVGLSRQVLEDKGTVRVNMQDLFYTDYDHGDVHYENVREYFVQKRDSRVVNISFTYRFGKQVKEQGRRSTGGAKDEQKRVGL